MASSVASRSSSSTVATNCSLAGLITSKSHRFASYIRSKVRTRSQSVTAASKAASSTRAVLA